MVNSSIYVTCTSPSPAFTTSIALILITWSTVIAMLCTVLNTVYFSCSSLGCPMVHHVLGRSDNESVKVVPLNYVILYMINLCSKRFY